VDITEEVSTLLRQLGATEPGLEKLLAPATLARLFSGVIDGNEDGHVRVVNVDAKDEAVMAPFMQLLQANSAQSSSSASSSVPAPSINSVILLRVLTLLTHIACGTQLQGDAAAASSVAGSGTVVPSASASSASALPEASPALRQRAWDLYERQGLFGLLLQVSSIGPGAGQDMLVQLNGLELLEEIVRSCPRLDDAFATRLTDRLLSPAVPAIRTAAAAGTVASGDPRSIILTSSFVTVGLLRVFNALASVSAARSTHEWYKTAAFGTFLSAAAQEYDEESVQAEAIDLLATLGSFEQGLIYFSSFVSTLPASTVAAPAQAATYTTTAYASSVTPVLLYQIPYFVYGSNYSNGLRQIASIHGIAKVLHTKYGEEEKRDEDVGLYGAGDAASAAVASDPSVRASPTALQSRFFSQLSAHNRGKAALDVLLSLAKQPFEDIREAVWKVVGELAKHAWVSDEAQEVCPAVLSHSIGAHACVHLRRGYPSFAGCVFDLLHRRPARISAGP
jgi:hypothetical protein